MWAVAFSQAKHGPVAATDGQVLQEVAERMIEDFDPAFVRIVEGADAADTLLTRVRTSTPAPAWRPGRVTLLGDAVHCMPPFGAHGANTALRDASGLARRLVAAEPGHEHLLSAIGAYEAEMRQYGFEAVRQADAGMRQIVGTGVDR